MEYQGWSDKSRELLEAKAQADHLLEEEGITFDFDLMEYVDRAGNVVSGEEVSQRRKHLIEQYLERRIEW